MQLWVVLLGSLAALLWIFVCARLLLEFELRARGEPSGAWFAALGIATGPLAFAGVAARGARIRLELHCFGKRIDLTRRREQGPEAPPTPDEATPDEGAAQTDEAKRDSEPLARTLDRAREYVALAGRLERRVRFESVAINLVYGFRDVALTGRIVGALAALSGVLPARVKLTHTPLWDGAERWEIHGQGRLGIWLGLVLKELLWYMLGRRFGRAPAEESPNGQDEHLRDRE